MERTVETPSGSVSVTVDGSGSASVLILAHGAGAGMEHPFMGEIAAGLAEHGSTIVRFNFAYVEFGRKAPDRQPVLEATYEAVVRHVRERLGPEHLFLGGKSMGGRIASHLVARGITCDGLVFLGYPLHPPGRPDRMRDQHLLELTTPMLFVEGTRDPFCPLDRLNVVRDKLRAPSELVVISDGDHSFRVRRSSGRTDAEALTEVIDGVAAWIDNLTDGSR